MNNPISPPASLILICVSELAGIFLGAALYFALAKIARWRPAIFSLFLAGAIVAYGYGVYSLHILGYSFYDMIADFFLSMNFAPIALFVIGQREKRRQKKAG